MGGWLILAVFLYLACAALIIAEVFIPSGGLLSVFAAACALGGIVLFFGHSTVAGWIGLILAAVLIPAALVVAYKVFPQTRFGRNTTLAPPERQRGDAIADSQELVQLLGDLGEVLTPLRPVGMCDFDGRRVECVAEGGYVEKGKTVKVIRVEGTQLTVRVMDEA